MRYYNNEGANLYIGTGGTEDMRITSSGDIGIGGINPNPSYKVDVLGNINISSGSDYYRNGISLTTSLNTTSNNAYQNSSNFAYITSTTDTNYNKYHLQN